MVLEVAFVAAAAFVRGILNYIDDVFVEGIFVVAVAVKYLDFDLLVVQSALMDYNKDFDSQDRNILIPKDYYRKEVVEFVSKDFDYYNHQEETGDMTVDSMQDKKDLLETVAIVDGKLKVAKFSQNHVLSTADHNHFHMDFSVGGKMNPIHLRKNRLQIAAVQDKIVELMIVVARVVGKIVDRYLILVECLENYEKKKLIKIYHIEELSLPCNSAPFAIGCCCSCLK